MIITYISAFNRSDIQQFNLSVFWERFAVAPQLFIFSKIKCDHTFYTA